MDEKYLGLSQGEEHRRSTVEVVSDGDYYSFEYHESPVPTTDLVVMIPGLADDSSKNIEGIEHYKLDKDVNYLTFRYDIPFSFEGYSRALPSVIEKVKAERVVFEAYSLGGTLLAMILDDHAEYSYPFSIEAAVFRAVILDLRSFFPRYSTRIRTVQPVSVSWRKQHLFHPEQHG